MNWKRGGILKYIGKILLQIILLTVLAFRIAQADEPPPPGPSPSFNCASPTSARDQLICGDRALSSLDGQLGRIYRDRRALLSPPGAKLLEASERSWLRLSSIVCADAIAAKDRHDCLQEQYKKRIAQLQKVERVGPFVFNSIDLYAAQPTVHGGEDAPPFYIHHVAYPQIDNVKSAEVAAWNQQHVRGLPVDIGCDGPSGDSDETYEIGYASERVVSLERQHYTYCHGGAHGFDDYQAENTLLFPYLRALTEEDVFGSGAAWIPILKEKFWSALLASGWSPPQRSTSDNKNIKEDIEAKVIRPDQWIFTKDGLRVTFSAYEGGCYACTPQPVVVPWASLNSILASPSIVP